MHDPLAVGTLSRRGLIWDLLLAAVFGFAAIGVQVEQSTPSTIAAILIVVALACRRLAPSLMIVLALASAAVQVATVDVAILGSLGYAALYYTAGGHPNRKVRFGSLAVGIIGSIVAGFVLHYQFRVPDMPPEQTPSIIIQVTSGILGSLFVVIGGWAIGFIRFQRRSVEEARVAGTIADLERKRMLDLFDEQAERTRLARNMHDVVAHSLAVVVAQAEGARYTLDANPDAARDALLVIADTARDALGDVRGLLEQLRDDDSPATPTDDDRQRLYSRMRTAGMILDITESGDPTATPDATIRTAHRVLIEALTNALKYGDLTQPVTISYQWGATLRLDVTNALSSSPLDPGGAGHGIRGMIERAVALGGTLTSTPTQGQWQVALEIPEPGTPALPHASTPQANNPQSSQPQENSPR